MVLFPSAISLARVIVVRTDKKYWLGGLASALLSKEPGLARACEQGHRQASERADGPAGSE
jgi:hypothetical protein